MEIGAKEAANLSFVAALAVRDTIAHYLPNQEVKVKWPNDVLVEGKKLSGILLESWINHGEIKIAIGIGINIVTAPENANISAGTIKEFLLKGNKAPKSENALEVLAGNFEKYISIWRESGFEPIRKQWLMNAIGIGRDVIVRLHDKEMGGVFKDINSNGELILELDNKSIELISAGDVFFPHLK